MGTPILLCWTTRPFLIDLVRLLEGSRWGGASSSHCSAAWSPPSPPSGDCPRPLARIFPTIERLGHHQVTAQNRCTASATDLATVALRAGDESTCSSARLTIIPASRSTAGIRDSYSTAI